MERTDMDTVRISNIEGMRIATYYRNGELRDIFRLPVKKIRVHMQLRAYMKAAKLDLARAFYDEVCLDCCEYPGACDGNDSDYCPRYARYIKTD